MTGWQAGAGLERRCTAGAVLSKPPLRCPNHPAGGRPLPPRLRAQAARAVSGAARERPTGPGLVAPPQPSRASPRQHLAQTQRTQRPPRRVYIRFPSDASAAPPVARPARAQRSRLPPCRRTTQFIEVFSPLFRLPPVLRSQHMPAPRATPRAQEPHPCPHPPSHPTQRSPPLRAARLTPPLVLAHALPPVFSTPAPNASGWPPPLLHCPTPQISPAP